MSNETEPQNRRLAGILGIFTAAVLVAAFFGMMHRSRSLVVAAEKRCDGDYRTAIASNAPLGPVKDCYVGVLRAWPWNNEVSFKIQSTGELESERPRAPETPDSPLYRLSHGDLAACNRIETDARLNTFALREHWMRLCIMLTQ